jgi:hypothetical protein
MISGDAGPMVNFGEYQVPFGVLLILGLFGAFLIVATVASNFMMEGIKFAVASILLSVGLAAFGAALFVLDYVYKLMTESGEMVSLFGYDVPFSILLIMGLFIAFTALGALLGLAAPAILLFGAAALLLSVALAAFAGALFLLDKVALPALKGIKAQLDELGDVGSIMDPIGDLLLAVGLMGLASVLALPGALALAVTSLAIFGAFKALEGALNSLREIQKIMTSVDIAAVAKLFKKGGKDLSTWGAVALLMDLLKDVDFPDKKRMRDFADSMGSIEQVFSAIKHIFEDAYELKDIVKDGREAIEFIMGQATILIEVTAKASKDLQGLSLEAALGFAVILKSITDSIDSIVSTMKEIQGIKKSDMDAATDNLSRVLAEFFGIPSGQYDKGAGSILEVFSQVQGIDSSKLMLAVALEPLTASIKNITEAIVTIKDLDKSQIDAAIVSLTAIKDFIAKHLVTFIDVFDTGGILGGLFKDDPAKKAQTGADTINALANSVIPAMTNIVGGLNGLTELGAGTAKKVTDLIDLLKVLNTFLEDDFFYTSKVKQTEVAAKSIEAITKNVLPKMSEISTTMDSMPAMGATTRAKVNNLIEAIAALNDFMGTFTGESIGGKIFSFFTGKASDSVAKAKTAEDSLKAILPVLSQMRSVSTAIEGLSGVTFDLPTDAIDKINAFVEGTNDSKLSNKNQREKFAATTDSLAAMIPTLQQLGKISQLNTDFSGIQANIKISILDPLAEIGKQVKNVDTLRTSLKNLNQELSKLARDNGKTMRQLTDLSSGGGLSSAPSSTATYSNEASAVRPVAGGDPNIAQILTLVDEINRKIHEEVPSYAGGTRTR